MLTLNEQWRLEFWFGRTDFEELLSTFVFRTADCTYEGVPPQPSCGSLNWWSHPRYEGDQGEVGVETPERKLNCRLRLTRYTQRGSAWKWTRGMRSYGGPSRRHVIGWRECEVQQPFVSSSATSLSWRSSCAWGISTDSSKTSNRCNWRRQSRSNHSASVTMKGGCCATKGVSARGGEILPLAAKL